MFNFQFVIKLDHPLVNILTVIRVSAFLQANVQSMDALIKKVFCIKGNQSVTVFCSCTLTVGILTKVVWIMTKKHSKEWGGALAGCYRQRILITNLITYTLTCLCAQRVRPSRRCQPHGKKEVASRMCSDWIQYVKPRQFSNARVGNKRWCSWSIANY